MSYALSKVAKSSTVVNFLFASVLFSACKKSAPIEVAEPVIVEPIVSVEESTDSEDSSETIPQSDVDSEIEASTLSEDVAAQQEEQKEALFADQVNNAVALLTGDDASTQKGLDALQTLDESNESSPEVPYNIGVAHLKLGNDRAAEKSFERAIELDPTFGKSWFNLGVILERQGQYVGAIAVYEEGLTHSKTDPDLSAGKIACLRKSGQLDEAISYAQQVLGKNANNVAAYSEVGAVYLEQGNLDKALFVLQQAAARNGGDNAKLQSIMGQVYYAQEKLPLAEVAFRKSLGLDPTLVETAMYLSFLQIQNRAWVSASETLDTAIKLDPTNGALLNAMGIAQRGQGNIDEAERYYKEAYQMNPSNPEPLMNMAVVEADYRQEYTKALDLLDKYLADGGTNVDLVDQWRNEFKESESAYLKEKKQQELRAIFRRRREEAAKKRAEEEAAQQAAQEQDVENAETDEDETSEGTDVEGTDVEVEEVKETESSDAEIEGTSTEETQDVDLESESGTDNPVQDGEDTESTDNIDGSPSESADATDDGSEATTQDTDVTNPDENNGWGASQGVETTEIEEAGSVDTEQPNVVNEAMDTDDVPVPLEEPSAEGDDEAEDDTDAEKVKEAESTKNTEDNTDANDGAEKEPVTEESDASTETIDATEQPAEDGGETWGSETDGEQPVTEESDDTVVENNSWGSTVEKESCSAQSDCTDDLICASTQECLPLGSTGTLQINEECETSEECALSLECVEQLCVQVEPRDVEE